MRRRPPPLAQEVVEAPYQRRRHTGSSAMGWALALSLILTHAVWLPLVALLLNPQDTIETPTQIELVASSKEPPLEKRPLRKKRLLHKIRPPKEEPKRLLKKPPAPQPRRHQPIPRQLKMVELNTPQTKEAPERARFLSDKNRRVERETRARIRRLAEKTQKPRAQKPRPQKPTPAQVARPRQQKVSPPAALAMRQLRLRPSRKSAISPDGILPRRPPEKRKRRLPRRNLSMADKQPVPYTHPRREQRRREHRPGRVAAKRARVRAALENFVPEVKPGNQTALATRANPFAVYIARMHRKVHPLWGWGFLVDLETKSDKSPFNNMRLHVTMEIAVNPDGSIARAMIVKPSGLLPYDVAALDTIFSAAPFPRSPRAIRSKNGKVYVHWTFYRNHRQCGTFNVHPYILTTPPEGPTDGTRAAITPAPAPHRRRLRRLSRKPGQWSPPPAPRPTPESMARAREAAKRAISARNARAARALHEFFDAFNRRDAQAMARQSHLPFRAHGRVVAKNKKTLARMLGQLLTEARGKAKLHRLMTPIQARRHWGRLPAGMRHGKAMLAAHARLGNVGVVVILQRVGKKWGLVGINRQ